jgi:NADPH2:quinone reductase
MGAGLVIAGVVGKGSETIAREAGADQVVDLSVGDLRNQLRIAVLGLTQGQGVDVVIDPVGGEATGAALRALTWCGQLVVIGFASGAIPTIKTNYLLLKNISMHGLQWSDYRDRTPERVAGAQQEIFSYYLNNKIDPIISRRFPLERFGEGLSLLRDGKAQGKIVLQLHS